jgi:hypothetical protein
MEAYVKKSSMNSMTLKMISTYRCTAIILIHMKIDGNVAVRMDTWALHVKRLFVRTILVNMVVPVLNFLEVDTFVFVLWGNTDIIASTVS